jgi:hypothetical protein
MGVACGDPVTGSEITDPGTNDGGGGAKDAGSDQSVSVPPRDSSAPDTNVPDTSGSGIDGGLPSASPATLDFGEVDCGSAGQAKTITIQNPSAGAIAWSSSLAKGASSGFTLSPESGNLGAGESVEVTVTPKQVPAASSTAANALGDVLTLSLGTTNVTIELKETAHGAILYFSPASLAFGNTPLAAAPVEANFAIANSGNAAVNATLTPSGDPEFSIVGSTTLSAVPGITGSKVKFTPAALQAYNGQVALSVGANEPLCAPLPTNLAVTGTGTDGILSVTPPTISFGNNGLVDCGATAAAQKVKITNSGNVAVTYNAVLTRGTVVYTVAPASGTVQANSFVELTVTPKQIPTSTATTPDLFNDTLTVTTNAVGDSPHEITLRETARGVILTRTQGSLSFGNVPIGTTSTQQFTFANAGNVDITLTFANALPEYVQASPVTISAGGFATPLVAFSPPITAAPLPKAYSDVSTYSVATAVPTCGGLPSNNISISGSAIATSLAASPSPVNFNLTPCGTAAAPRTVRITNNGPATTFTASLVKGIGSPFTIAPDNGPMTAGGFVDIVITPKLIPGPPATSTTASNGFGDTLEVTSGNNPISPLTVPINQTAQGAVINYNNKPNHAFNNVSRSANPAGVFTTLQVNNTGNLNADVTFSTTGSPANVFTLSTTGPLPLASGTNVQPILTFLPVANVAYSGTFFATATAPTFCAPLPNVMTLTGTGTP